MNIQKLLSRIVSKALIANGAPDNCDSQIRQTTNANYGDYQSNGVMTIAKQLRVSPIDLAYKVVSVLKVDGIAHKIDIMKPGFINIFLDPNWIAARIEDALGTKNFNITPVTPQTIVIDYSSPNLAKEMHVGHLRSTIIGDSMVRVLEFIGHNVIRANHVGDWGTQFGMLIAYLDRIQRNNNSEVVDLELSSLDMFYRLAKQLYDTDLEFAKHARNYVVKLQSGDRQSRKIWRNLVNISIRQNQYIYDRLKVKLTCNDIIGESFYNDMLPGILEDLQAKGLVTKSAGASVIILDEFKNKDGKLMGVIFQKKDGAYLYSSTDIACAKYRYETLHADRIIYYIDSRQHEHLVHAWAIVRKAGYVPISVPLEHHMFGTILGKNGKPFQTRTGGTIKLVDLLDEAIHRARRLIVRKQPDLDPAAIETLAEVIGIGAVKYSDLLKNRTTNYVFDWDNMLSFEGNTAPYIQYAHTRITSIFKHSDVDEYNIHGKVYLKSKHEIKLAVRLLQFEETIITVARDGTPHILCYYLYDLASQFSLFYENCPILTAGKTWLRNSRLKLCLLTSRTIAQGLYLLGIQTTEKM